MNGNGGCLSNWERDLLNGEFSLKDVQDGDQIKVQRLDSNGQPYTLEGTVRHTGRALRVASVGFAEIPGFVGEFRLHSDVTILSHTPKPKPIYANMHVEREPQYGDVIEKNRALFFFNGANWFNIENGDITNGEYMLNSMKEFAKRNDPFKLVSQAVTPQD